MNARHGLRQRLVSGARAQVFGQAIRTIIQIGGVAIFTATWGLQLYGEWLILAAVPLVVALSDLGFVTAAVNEMVMSVGREDRDRARAVLKAVTRVLLAAGLALAVLLPLLVTVISLTSVLNLSAISESTAGLVVVLLGFDTLLVIYASLLYGGYASIGRYGEGVFAIAAIAFLEFCAIVIALLAGGGPDVVAGAMLTARLIATAAMYIRLRYRAPWLWQGKERPPQLLRSMLSPALASGAFPVALGLNVQGTALMIGIVTGPVSLAIFSTLRTLSRSVVQLVASVNLVVSPELSTAYASEDPSLLRTLHRHGCQVAVWSAGLLVGVLAVFGNQILGIWTSQEIQTGGTLYFLFLAVSMVSSLWYTSAAVLIATNRHQRIAIDYLVASLLALPLGYGLLTAMGLDGAAIALLMLELFMAVSVLRRAVPAAHDSLRGLLAAIGTPPVSVVRDVLRLRKTGSAVP